MSLFLGIVLSLFCIPAAGAQKQHQNSSRDDDRYGASGTSSIPASRELEEDIEPLITNQVTFTIGCALGGIRFLFLENHIFFRAKMFKRP